MYDCPEVAAENREKSRVGRNPHSCSKARYYNPNIGRFISEDAIFSFQFAIANDSYRAPLIQYGGENLYPYTYNKPILMRDPSGLSPRKCESGRCPDCPSGLWTITSADGEAFASPVGAKVGLMQVRCLENAFTCYFSFFCGNFGLGLNIGVNAGGGVGGGKECVCGEDWGSWSFGAEGSGGKGFTGGGGSGGFGSNCKFGTIQAGFGVGAEGKWGLCYAWKLGCSS